MQTPGDGSFFECSAQPIVSLATNELTRRGFLAFCTNSAILRNLFFRMKLPLRSLFVPLAVVLAAALTTAPLLAKSDAGNVTTSVGRLLEEGHYTHQALNDEVSKKFLKTYLELLDFSHLFFTQQDVDMLTAKYGTSLDDDILLQNVKPAYEIYDLYMKRVVVVDHDVDIFNDRQVSWAIATRCQPDRDILIVTNARGSDLDPSTKEDGYTGKWGVDATAKPSVAAYTPRHRIPKEVWQRINLKDFAGK